MACKVFISYSSKNLNVVDWARSRLTQPGLTEVFAAEYSVAPGAVLNAEIIQAIRSCDLFVLLWTHDARASDYVQQEIGIAVDANKLILPVVMEDNLPVPGFISCRKYLNAHEDWNGSFHRLTEVIQSNARRQQDQHKTIALVVLLIGGIWLLSQGG